MVAARTMLLGLLASVLVAGCGNDDDGASEKPAEVVAVEDALLAKLVNQTDEGEPTPKAVTCPADADLDAVPAEFTCAVSGSGDSGSLEVTLRADGYNYTGMFGPSSFGGTGDGPLAEVAPEAEPPAPEVGGGY